jgi:serine/threonine protein kinase
MLRLGQPQKAPRAVVRLVVCSCQSVLGSIVSHYRIIEHLGGGGMGVVYRAEYVRLGREVALKLLSDRLITDVGPPGQRSLNLGPFPLRQMSIGTFETSGSCPVLAKVGPTRMSPADHQDPTATVTTDPRLSGRRMHFRREDWKDSHLTAFPRIWRINSPIVSLVGSGISVQ